MGLSSNYDARWINDRHHRLLWWLERTQFIATDSVSFKLPLRTMRANHFSPHMVWAESTPAADLDPKKP